MERPPPGGSGRPLPRSLLDLHWGEQTDGCLTRGAGLPWGRSGPPGGAGWGVFTVRTRMPPHFMALGRSCWPRPAWLIARRANILFLLPPVGVGGPDYHFCFSRGLSVGVTGHSPSFHIPSTISAEHKL